MARTMIASLYHKKQPHNRFSNPGGLEKRLLGCFLWYRMAIIVLVLYRAVQKGIFV